jgi:NAD+ kinase
VCFKTIGLIGRLNSQSVVETLSKIIAWLKHRQCRVLLDERIGSVMTEQHLITGSTDFLGQHCDLVIVVGGDGSMLSAARVMAVYGVPVIGVNRGRLGFLTDILPDEIEVRLEEVLAGHYEESNRFMLSAKVLRQEKVIGTGSGLNDVVMHPGQSGRMLTFELIISNQQVYFEQADGLIIATPTGSTAYALSAGGPIMHPNLDAIALVPMHPHSLNSRPLVVAADSDLELLISDRNTTGPTISCDGQVHINCAPGDRIRIHRHASRLRVLHPLGHHFYGRCRSKLGWQTRQDID